jgi:hypothetical protein
VRSTQLDPPFYSTPLVLERVVQCPLGVVAQSVELDNLAEGTLGQRRVCEA